MGAERMARRRSMVVTVLTACLTTGCAARTAIDITALPSASTGRARPINRPGNAMSVMVPAVVLAAVALLAGCAPLGGSSPRGHPQATPSWSTEAPATITGPDCPGGGDCAFGFDFDDVFVEVNCRGVREGVTDRVVAVGADGVGAREARAITGVSPHLLVAVRNSSDVCEAEAEWVAGIVQPGEHSIEEELALSIAACQATGAPYTYPYRDTHDCEQGGPARVNFEGPDASGAKYAWFPSVVADVNRALQAGQGPDFRREPAAVIAAFEKREFTSCFADDAPPHLQMCRIGRGALPPEPEGAVVVTGVTQTRTDSVGFESQTIEWTVEQLGDGPGWWITRKAYQPVANVTEVEADRTWEQCCTQVITQVDDRSGQG